MKKTLLALILSFSLPATVLGGSASQKPIRLAYLQSDIHQLACWVAIEKGFFKEEGAHVEVTGIFKAGPEQMSAFAAGALDAGYVGEAPATTAVANGVARVTVLAQVNTEGSALVVGKDSELLRITDLSNKSVAIPGHATVQDFLLKKAIFQGGLDPKSIKIIVLKPPEMIGALGSNQIDAFVAWEPFPAKSETLGVGRRLLTSRQIWEEHPCCVLVVDDRFLAERPEEAKALVRGHVRATDFIVAQPEEAALIGEKYTGMDRETVRNAMGKVTYTYHLSIEGEKEYVDFLSQLKYIKVKDAEEFVGRFINQEIIGEIIKK
jgi:NitT/TauT family transport system substrate-binding protein